MTRIFVDDDAGYMRWLKKNPGGFVVNTHHSLDASYSCLHRATCSTISTYTSKARPKGCFTERQYAKVCSNDSEDLREWTRKNGGPGGSFSNVCSRCGASQELELEELPGLEGVNIEFDENPTARVNEDITINLLEVLELLRSDRPFSFPTSFKNLFVVRDNGERIGAKAIVHELSGGTRHHGNQAAIALMKLGVPIRVMKWVKTYEKKPWNDFFEKGLLVVEGSTVAVLSKSSIRVRSLTQQLDDEGAFDPHNTEDAREKTLGAIVHRRGQPAFRRALLAAYKARCAVTGCTVAEVLEAAHITPYRGKQTNRVQNGLLLRTDIHTLFDLGLVAIDTAKGTFRLVISKTLANTEYAHLAGKHVSVPDEPRLAPSREALERHRKEVGL